MEDLTLNEMKANIDRQKCLDTLDMTMSILAVCIERLGGKLRATVAEGDLLRKWNALEVTKPNKTNGVITFRLRKRGLHEHQPSIDRHSGRAKPKNAKEHTAG